ncbi:MAG: bifunctional riboflavin kinase/FMN adenylyltransferase [Planctomycetales bacterium]
MEQRLELFKAQGVENAIVYPTDEAFLALEPSEFFNEVLLRQLRAKGLVEGPNFFYGRNRAGTVETLCAACAHEGIGFEVVPAVTVAGEVVSSSSIRKLLGTGDVTKAAEFLGRRYSVEGIVKTGAARGRTIGFPTANLGEISTMLPLDGVYATLVEVEGRNYAGALNLGPNPTFREEQRKFEVHLLDFQGDLYGRRLTVEFVSRLRETRKFAAIDELLKQVTSDVEVTRLATRTLTQR